MTSGHSYRSAGNALFLLARGRANHIGNHLTKPETCNTMYYREDVRL